MAETTSKITSRILGILRKGWFPGAVLTILMVAAFVSECPLLYSFEYGLYDSMVSMREVDPASDVVLVGVDDYTLSRLGRTDRVDVARAIRHVSELGARVVGVDLLFQSEEENLALEGLRAIANTIGSDKALMKDKEAKGIYAELRRAEKSADGDDALLKAMKVKARLVLPVSFELYGGEGLTPVSPVSTVVKHSIKAEPRVSTLEMIKNDLAALRNPAHMVMDPVVSGSRIAFPFESLAGKVRALGHTNIVPDSDAVVRRDRLFISYAGRLYPSMALQTALRYHGLGLSDYAGTYKARGVGGLDFGTFKVPVGANYSMLLSVRESPPVVSFMDVLDGALPEGVFKGKAVLIGDLSSGALRYPSSEGKAPLTAVELQARSVMDMLSGSPMVRPGWAFALEFLVLAYFGAFVSFILPRVRLKAGLTIMGLSLLPLWIAAFAMFFAAGYWLMAASASMFLLAGVALVAGRQYVSFGWSGSALAEHVESHKMLGLSFQGQGMLDLALEHFMKVPMNADESIKGYMYNLANDFERKRMHHKAEKIYMHLLSAGPYKDVEARLAALAGGTSAGVSAQKAGGLFAGGAADSTMQLDGGGVLPTLGRYEVVRELGRGAMGTVYLGRDPKINREVAIKTLLYEDVDPEDLEDVKQRFFREAEAAGRLSHPNIITIYDAGEEHDLAYMAMEIINGDDLKQACAKGSLMPMEEVLRLVADVADALSYAHKQGIVHRDIKPANIMLLEDGTAKVADFGIARVVESSKTQTGTVLGTPSYMSPEQVEGKKLTGPSDIFSLGVTFYEMLSGEKPFGGDSIATIMFNVTKCKYAPIREVAPDVSECIAQVIDKMLVKALTKRYKDGADVARDIRACT